MGINATCVPPFLMCTMLILTPLAPPNVLVPVIVAAGVLLLKVCVAVLVVTTPSIVTTPAPGLAIVVSLA